VNPYLAVTVLVSVVSLMFLLPLIPAFVELRRKADALPLTVIQQNAGDIRYFAHSFRAYIKVLEPIMRRCVAAGTSATGTLPDGENYVVLGQVDEPLVLAFQQRDAIHPVVTVAGSDLIVPPDLTFSKDIYAGGHFQGGEKNHYRAILGEKNVHLGSSSLVMRWVHAVGEFTAGLSCRLYGRTSSDSLIRLHAGCSFLRLNAPRIEIGHAAVLEDALPLNSTIPAIPGPPQPSRFLHHGDFEIHASQVISSDIVIRGKLLIRSGARVCGSVKSDKEMVLEDGVSVEGSLISASKMHIGPRCAIYGPVIAERELAMAVGARCGTVKNPTTVSAPRIEVEEGVVVFGTLWAREHGQVVSQ
jgi:cytoskeletal protein CcmA (bactofilin family)